MKNIFLFLFYFTAFFNGFSQQVITICTQNNGCEYAKVNLTKSQIDNILEKPNFLAKENGTVILNMVACVSLIEKMKTIQAIHEAHFGKGEIKEIKNFDLRKYLFEKGCLVSCPNTTKRISFQLKSDEINSSGYYFHNIQAEESFMPNDSWQKLYKGEMKNMVINTFIKKNKNISYSIAENQKWKIITPYGTIFNDINNASFSSEFHKKLKKTGNKKQFLNTKDFQFEYTGKDDDGKIMSLWLAPAGKVCYNNVKSIAAGFYHMGYIVLDGITYLISELSSSEFNVKVTGIEDETYSFDTSGYKEISGF